MKELGSIDLIVLALYFVGTISVGFFFYKKSKSAEGFTSGNSSFPGWLCGMSIFATYLSSLSFIGIPGKAYADNWSFFAFSLSLPIAVGIAYKFFVPYYRKSTSISAYEDLEKRFGYFARLYANVCFLTTQVARMGAVIYLTAVPMELLLGWNIKTIVLIIGISVTLYAFVGGITAVIWSDAIQSFVLIGGAFVCILVMLFTFPEGTSALFSTAVAEGKFSLGSFGNSLTEETFWVIMAFGIIINLQNFGIDQNFIQRYKSSKNDKEAGKSLLIGGLLYIPVSAMFFFIGSILFAYYKSDATVIPAEIAAKADYVFPYYIIETLPTGLRGLLIAAIFAAAMSTVSTSLNSSATLIMYDFYKRFKKDATDVQCMRVLHVSTVVLGFSGVLAAFIMSKFGGGFKIWQLLAGIFSGGMLGLFILGMISKRVNNIISIMATIAGVVVIVWMTISSTWPDVFGKYTYPWNAFLIPVFGTLMILAVGLLLSRFKIFFLNRLNLILFGFVLLLISGCAAVSDPVMAEHVSIIPQPQRMVLKDGRFVISPQAKVSYNDAKLADAAKMLAVYIGVDDKNIRGDFNRKADFILQLNADADKALAQEGYELLIDEDRVSVRGNTAAGVFYGIQSIRQLLPVSAETGGRENVRFALPCVEINDVPRYTWRGFMLDESRHFFGSEQVKKTLDIMAFYKMNRFHWHLTDMPGWRLEIKQYPKLAEVGGKGDWSSSENKGGFYTQQQVRDILEYAHKRHIIVVPEIDMPGHATAANRAYPEFSGGGTDRHPEFTFNPGKEGTYEYLEYILGETAELFRSPWIHFGGDEVHFASKKWRDNADVQGLMKKHNLKDLYEVETYFNRRMAKVIKSLSRTTIGWDEVVDAGLSPEETVVMWWRHDKPGQLKKAIEKGFDVVLCPRIPCYFDFIQHQTHKYGRTWKGYCDLEGVYEYPDKPASYWSGESASQKNILGIQANLWTERVHNLERFNYMTYPRLSALAEAAWTEKDNKSYDSYEERLKSHLDRYDAWGINYFNPFDPVATPEPVWPEKKAR